MDPTDSDHPYNTFARELGTNNLPLVHRLLAEHPPTGPCFGCALPGPQGVPPSPCSIRSLALTALSIRLHADADEVAR